MDTQFLPQQIVVQEPACARIVRLRIAERPKAANDNEVKWPLVPFPDGWYACC